MSPGMVGDAPAGVKAVQQMLMLQSSEMEAAERIPGGMRAREVAAYLKAIRQAFLKAGHGLSGYRR